MKVNLIRLESSVATRNFADRYLKTPKNRDPDFADGFRGFEILQMAILQMGFCRWQFCRPNFADVNFADGIFVDRIF